MKINFSFDDIWYYFRKNRGIFITFLIFIAIGMIVGIFIAVSSNSIASILTSSDKVFFDYIKGNISFSTQTGKMILNTIIFQLLIFLLCLNYYSGMVSFLLFSYQGMVLLLSVVAIISEFGFSGIIISLLLILPVNIILILNNVIFSGICLNRSRFAAFQKTFGFGFDNKNFWLAIGACVIFVIVFSSLINLLILIILKSRIFIIF